MNNSANDVKTLKNWIVGILAFATTMTAFLCTVFNFDVAITTGASALIATILVVVVYLISKAEERSMSALAQHKKESEIIISRIEGKLDNIDTILLDIQRSSLRTEMNLEIARNPQNHDTILRYAQRYFVGLKGDWVETEIFMKWKDDEEAAGRPVHISGELLAAISSSSNMVK